MTARTMAEAMQAAFERQAEAKAAADVFTPDPAAHAHPRRPPSQPATGTADEAK